MASVLRNRSSKRHDSDTAVIQQERQSRTDSEVEDLKDELADRVETWRAMVQKVRLSVSSLSSR